jgi:hypothetical protein
LRLCIFALLLCAGPVAFGQSAPSNPDQFGKFPSPWNAPGRDFNTLPQQWSSLRTMPFGKMHLPPTKATAPLGDAAIDPKIVVHPAERNLGTQPPGTLVAQNLYPGLRLLPIGDGKPGAPPQGSAWPELRIEKISIVWPELKREPVSGGVAVSAGAPGK